MPKMSDLTEEAYGVKDRERERKRERTIKFLVPSEKLLLFLKREFFCFLVFEELCDQDLNKVRISICDATMVK